MDVKSNSQEEATGAIGGRQQYDVMMAPGQLRLDRPAINRQ